MSVSDPLIKDLKGCIQQFLKLASNNVDITDRNFYFLHFAQTLEKIFNKGLIRHHSTKYFNRTIDPYAWMVVLDKSEADIINYTYKNCVDNVKSRRDVHTNEGRFKLLIKFCLIKKCLHVPVEFLTQSKEIHLIYAPDSIIGDEILSEILLSVLRQMSKMRFELDTSNSSFLDTSWYVSKVLDIEMVPCKSLGITISFAGNKAVIVEIQRDGLAAENGNIKVGDVLDKLNGVPISCSSKGKLGLIMRYNKNKPVTIRVVKAYDTEDKSFFQPIEALLKELKIDLQSVKKQYETSENQGVNIKKPSVFGYEVRYLAKVDVGSLGAVKQVQKALRCLRDNHVTGIVSIERFDKSVALEVGELGVKMRDNESTQLLEEYSYMQISSCGNLPIAPKLFGFCAGEENCDVAKNFICLVFEATTYQDADTLLQSIGQGFHRTHYAV